VELCARFERQLRSVFVDDGHQCGLFDLYRDGDGLAIAGSEHQDGGDENGRDDPLDCQP